MPHPPEYYLKRPSFNHIATELITHMGETHTLQEWASIVQIPYVTLRMRYSRGKRGDDLFTYVQTKTKSVQVGRNSYATELITHRTSTKEMTLTLKEWAGVLHIPYEVLYSRYKSGKRGSALFAKYNKYNKSKPISEPYETPVMDYEPTQ